MYSNTSAPGLLDRVKQSVKDRLPGQGEAVCGRQVTWTG